MSDTNASIEDVIESAHAVSDDIVFSDLLNENVSEVLSESLYHADGSPLSPENQIKPEHISQLNSIAVTGAIKALSEVDVEDLDS